MFSQRNRTDWICIYQEEKQYSSLHAMAWLFKQELSFDGRKTNLVVVQSIKLMLLLVCLGVPEQQRSACFGSRINLPARLRAGRKKSKASSVSFYMDGHQKVWPRFRVVHPASDDPVKKT